MRFKFGLVGKNIDYSFSRTYFSKKFKAEGLKHSYDNFDINTINAFLDIVKDTPNLKGVNVTIPYKEAIIPLLDTLHKTAKKIGAVNTIKITKKGKLKGYNTDYYGFKTSIQPYLKPQHKRALILGTGGASKAVAYALTQLNIDFSYVSRHKNSKAKYSYNTLTKDTILAHQIIINCTPLGTHPNINNAPDIPYIHINASHLLYDLIYNPKDTKFLQIGEARGAAICNGTKMLMLQAEKSWAIWNKV